MPSRDPSPSSTDAPIPAPPSVFEHPSRIGPYRVLRVLGEGGMGVVYLAEQTEPVHRQVALKILKLGMDTRQVVARFESERQALAVMEHPGIAKVYDAGATGAGRPYFVMERVDGVPLTEYCDAHRLSVRERVRLFTQVCRAVQHAHQKGVIHRDLKPSNVLVTTAGEEPLCKVIDFGIAKATEQSAPERTALTQADQMMGTPAYMSPEQVEASGLDVDTRADVYSLGVLLYQLLAGTLPFDARAYQGWGFIAQHLVREPPPPSVRFAALEAGEQARIAGVRGTDPAGLRRELRAELDWIVLRAMEKDRERRYETANGLAVELERYLAHEPVLAGPPSRTYRLRKFARRNRAGVAFASTLAVLLVAFASSVAVQNRRIAHARDLAEARQAQAEDLIGFMLGDLRGKLTPIGRLDVLDGVGEKALAYFAAVPESELSDEELYRRSEALRQIGDVRFEQGDQDAAMEAFRESLRLARGLAARDPENAEWQVGLGAAHFWVGYVHWRRGELDDALRHFVPYLRISEGLVASEPENLDYRLELGYAHSNLGSVREAAGDLEGALSSFRSTLSAKRALAEREPDNLDWRMELAHTYNTLGVVQRKMGDLDGALESHHAELAIKEELVARDSSRVPWRRFLMLGHFFMAVVLEMRGDVDGALASYQACREIGLSLVARDPSNAQWRRGLAVGERRLGLLHLSRGELARAREILHSSRTHLEGLLGTNPESADLRTELAATETALARMLLRSGRVGEALQRVDRALGALRTASAQASNSWESSQLLGEAYLTKGSVLARAGRPEDAREMWIRAVAVTEPAARASRSTELLVPWATALLQLGRTGEAQVVLDELRRREYREGELWALARRMGAPS